MLKLEEKVKKTKLNLKVILSLKIIQKKVVQGLRPQPHSFQFNPDKIILETIAKVVSQFAGWQTS